MKIGKRIMENLKLNEIILLFLLINGGLSTLYLVMLPQNLSPASETSLTHGNFNLPAFSYQVHAPIFIDDNSDFTTLGFPGNGTPINPFLIDNYNITGSSTETLIEIRNTNLYFKITDCYLDRGKYGLVFTNVTNAVVFNNTIKRSKGLVGQGDAIDLNSCYNSNFTHNRIIGHDHIAFSVDNSHFLDISYNNITHNDYGGIYLGNSHNNTLTNNYLFNSSMDGINLWYSADNLISGNIVEDQGKGIYIYSGNGNNITSNRLGTIGDNGIRIEDSHSNYLINNTLNVSARNIVLMTAPNNTILDNQIAVLGLMIAGTTLKDHLQTQVANNWVNNRPLIFWQHIKGGVVPSDVGQVILINCTDTEVSEQNLSNLTSALQVLFCTKMSIINNTITDADFNGIYLYNTRMSQIQSNNIYRTVSNGIYIVYSDNNTFNDNLVSEGLDISFYIWGSHENNLSQNIISRSLGWGMLLGQSNNNTVMLNRIENSSYEGIYFYDSNNNNIERNDFLFNYIGNPQAFDDQTNPNLKNIFLYNHWNDWTTPDNDSNRIVDQPYAIGGSANNQDLYPLTVPYLQYVHKITKPTLVHPNGGEILSGIITIQWIMANDSWDHNITYTLYYSSDNGSSWNLLQTNLTVTSYTWDTNTVADGSEYLIQVIANCSEGLSISDYSNNPFKVENLKHALSIPHIIYPNGGESLTGEITIQWVNATDSWNHLVLYALYYSANNGSTWILLVSNLNTNSYLWDTLTIDEGTDYLIKVVATCTDNLTITDISDHTFSVTRVTHQLSPLIILYPNGGEVISGSITIIWIEVDDSLNHSITYFLYLSYDNGVTWFELANNLILPTYIWNSKSVADGDNYLIKVIAKCSEGLEIEAVSDATFIVQNVIPTTTTSSTVPVDTSTTTTSPYTITTTTTRQKSPTWSFIIVIISILSLLGLKKRKKS